MIDTGEDEMTGGIERRGIVSDCLKAVFSNQFSAARQAKLKLLAKGVVDLVLRISDRRLRADNAAERLPCYHRNSRGPPTRQRNTIARAQLTGHYVPRPPIRPAA